MPLLNTEGLQNHNPYPTSYRFYPFGGKYEISSDANYIYITKGMIDETAFSISKEKACLKDKF